LSLSPHQLDIYDKVRKKDSSLEGRVVKKIPQEYGKISRWATRQRRVLRRKTKGREGTMNYVKISLLDEIQFDWREEEREEEEKKKKKNSA